MLLSTLWANKTPAAAKQHRPRLVVTLRYDSLTRMVEGDPADPAGGDQAVPEDREATLRLLTRARGGDRDALEQLFARYAPELRRFARGRLPQWARDMADTPDIVQETLLQTFKHIGEFEHRGEGALRAYMRQALMNRIRDELRRASRRPAPGALPKDVRDAGPSPLEHAIGREGAEGYEAALALLKDDERELIVARVELGLSYREIAAATGRASANAARMAVVRALLRLSEEIGGEGPNT
jgi:RNA polymerase sigma factor (sigma-70 family)